MLLKVPSFGGSGGGGNVVKHCTLDYISEFYGKAGDAVDGLGVKCGGHFWDAGYVGGKSGASRSVTCIDGFSAAKVTYGELVGQVAVYCKAKGEYYSIGNAGWSKARGKTGQLKCDGNQVLVRADISGGSYVDRVTFYCGGIRYALYITFMKILFLM